MERTDFTCIDHVLVILSVYCDIVFWHCIFGVKKARGGHPPLRLTASICENSYPFLSYIKRKCDKFSDLTDPFGGGGRGGGNPSSQLDRFITVFFTPSLRRTQKGNFPVDNLLPYLAEPSLSPIYLADVWPQVSVGVGKRRRDKSPASNHRPQILRC